MADFLHLARSFEGQVSRVPPDNLTPDELNTLTRAGLSLVELEASGNAGITRLAAACRRAVSLTADGMLNPAYAVSLIRAAAGELVRVLSLQSIDAVNERALDATAFELESLFPLPGNRPSDATAAAAIPDVLPGALGRKPDGNRG